MANEINLIARRAGSDFNLFCNGVQFGRLADCEVQHVYEGEFSDSINANMEGDFSIGERLNHIRKVLEKLVAGRGGVFSAEEYAAYGMERRKIGETLNIPRLSKEANGIVNQASSAIRTRGMYS